MQSGTQILAVEDDNAAPLLLMAVNAAVTPDGIPAVITTPATRPLFLPTPVSIPAAIPVSPPVIPTTHVPPLPTPVPRSRDTPAQGTIPIFPSHLAPGSRVMGVPDPTSPGHF